jgi:hypothetical protein
MMGSAMELYTTFWDAGDGVYAIGDAVKTGVGGLVAKGGSGPAIGHVIASAESTNPEAAYLGVLLSSKV